jgi:hypothetical protein
MRAPRQGTGKTFALGLGSRQRPSPRQTMTLRRALELPSGPYAVSSLLRADHIGKDRSDRRVYGLIGAGGRNRTDTPFGNGILSAARLPVPPRPRSYRHSADTGTRLVRLASDGRFQTPLTPRSHSAKIIRSRILPPDASTRQSRAGQPAAPPQA